MRTKQMNRHLCFRNLASLQPAPTAPYWRGLLAFFLLWPVTALAGPGGEQVTAGSAAVSRPDAVTTVINQQSQKVVIDWQSFSIAQQEKVRFQQLGTSSVALNRVVGNDPSSIFGRLDANGQVFLVNPNGVLFGSSSHISVHGLLATTHDIKNDDFMAGHYHFSKKENLLTGAEVVNQGNIQAGENGYIVLAGDYAANNGLIQARLGQVALASGNRFTLDLDGDQLIGLAVDEATLAQRAGVENVGNINADGGKVLMTARVAGDLISTVVNNDGLIQARSIEEQNGEIILQGGTSGIVVNSGTLDASGIGAGENGGRIRMLGEKVGLLGQAVVDVAGAKGGGTALIGGDYQGKNIDVQNATVTYVGQDTVIKADATENGDGGKVIVWADDVTRAYGSISARGGASGGNGGFVETSGHRHLDVTRAPDLAAPLGTGGTWLLDPESITISSSANNNITGSPTFAPSASGSSTLNDTILRAALVAGGTVNVDTTGGIGTTGNILVDATANLASIAAGPAAVLNLKAHNDITVNSTITATTNPLTINFTADQDSNSSGTVTINTPLNSNNGDISVTSYGNISLNAGTGTNLNAGSGTVTLTSTGGSIQGDPAGPALDVAAASVVLNSSAGISANGGSAQFSVDAGSIGFTNSGTELVRINNNRAGASTFAASSTNGLLVLESFYSASPTSVGNINAGDNIVFRINNINITNPINAGANTVFLAPYTANSPVSIAGSSTFDLTGGELSNITAGKIIVGYDTFGNYASSASIGATALGIVTNSANLEVVAPSISTGPNSFTNADGQVSLAGDSITLGGPINVGTGTVWLRGKSSTQHIDLGGNDAAGTLGLTNAELNQVTAGTVYIGDTIGTGNLNVSAPIAPSGTPTLGLGTGGNITQSGAITATNLAIKALGNVSLDTATNMVANLAASIGDISNPNKNFSFKNGSSLNVGNIDGINGINIYITGTYDPSAPDGAIALITGVGALTQSAGATLAGKAVYAEGMGVDLSQNNPTGIIAGKATGAAAIDTFAYTSVNDLHLSTVNGFKGVQHTNGSFAGTDAVVLTGPSISQDVGAITGAPVDTPAGKGLLLTTTGPISLSDDNNNVSQLNIIGTLTGPLDFKNKVDLNFGGVTTANQSVWLETLGTATLTVSGAVDAGSGSILLGGGNVTTSANISGNNVQINTGGDLTINGTVNSSSTVNLIIPGILTISNTGAVSGPNLALAADNMDLQTGASISAVAGSVWLKPYTANQNIDLGGADTGTTLGLTDNELNTVTADKLRIGELTAGNLNISAAVAPSVTAVLRLESGGDITQAGSITATNLEIITLGNIIMNSGANLTTTATSGNSLVLDASSGNFTNNSGNVNPFTMTGTARWLLYAATPASVTKSGITSDFRHYNATIASYEPVNVTETGNGFIYASIPGILTVSTTLASGSSTHIYGDTPTAGFGYTLSGFADAEDNSGNIGLTGTAAFNAPTATSNAGSYSVTYTNGLANVAGYSFASNAGLAYNVTPATLTLTADNQSRIYGDANPSFTYSASGFKLSDNSSVITTAPMLATTATETTSVGSAPITITAGNAGSNYTLAYVDGSLTIAQRPLSVTANPQTKPYGDADPSLTYTVGATTTGSGLIATDNLSGSLDRMIGETIAGGPYAINQGSLTAGSNYTLTYTGNYLSIVPATLTLTADNQSRIYGEANPSFTYSVSGFKFSDNSSVITTAPVLATTATETTNAGSVPITITAGTADNAGSNYTLAYVDGTLTIAQRPVTVTANPQTKTYGDADPNLTYTVGATTTGSGLITSDNLSGTLDRQIGETVAGGPYAINQGSLTAGSNYILAYTGNYLSITPATLTLTADDQSRIYGEANPAFTYSASGFKFSDNLSVITTAPVLATTATETTNASSAPITITAGYAGSNYMLAYVDGTLTITQLPTDINVDDVTLADVQDNLAVIQPLITGNIDVIAQNPGNDNLVSNSSWDGHTGGSDNQTPTDGDNQNMQGADDEQNQPPEQDKDKEDEEKKEQSVAVDETKVATSLKAKPLFDLTDGGIAGQNMVCK